MRTAWHCCARLLPGLSSAFRRMAICSLPTPLVALGADAARTRKGFPVRSGDQLEVTVLRLPEIQSLPVTVDDLGEIDLPIIGRVVATGRSPQQVQQAIEDKLGAVMHEPNVRLRATRLASRPVSVIGAVKEPGVHQLAGDMRLVEALSLAGGLREDAGYLLSVSRSTDQGELPLPGVRTDESGRYWLAEVEVEELLRNKNPVLNIAVRPNDVLSVPRAKLVYVIGAVNKAGGFVLAERESVSVLQALALAEGLRGTASPRRARIIRPRRDSEERDEVPVDVKRILSGRAQDVSLLPEDVLFIPTSAAKSAGKIALGTALDLGTGLVIFR